MTFCNGCTACCRGDTIELQPGDDPAQFETTERDGKLYLRNGRDGDCIYLLDDGCAIYDRQPRQCRAFNCVDYFKSKSRQQRRALERMRPDHFGQIFDAARERME